MVPSKTSRQAITILDLHESIFHEIFRFLDIDTVYVKIRAVCCALRIYAESFVQLSGVFVLHGHGYCKLLRMYKLKQNIIFISVPSRMPYLPSHAIIYRDSFWGRVDDKVLVWGLTRTNKGLWTKDALGKIICQKKNKIYWPCELMLKCVYEYNPKENKWIKFTSIDPSSVRNDGDVLNDHHFRVMWYPIGNMGLILALKNNISKNAPYPVCFPDPLIMTPDYRTHTLYDVNSKQSFSHMPNDGDLYSYPNIPLEISSLENFVIIRVSDNKIIIFGGHNALGQNLWLWQGELTNERSLIKWTRKCKIGRLRYFCSGNPFGFKLGDDLYFVGYDDRIDIEQDGIRSESHQRQAHFYCDRYNLTEDQYNTNIYSVPSSLNHVDYGDNNHIIVLKDKHETFALIIAGANRELSFHFTAGKGFEETPTVIYSNFSSDYICNLFKMLYHPIQVL